MKQPVRTIISKGVAIWITVIETAVGGFTLDTADLVDGTILSPGTPVTYDESTRIAKIVKTAVLFADATNSATTYQVAKGHNLVVGENYGAILGQKAYAVTAIDSTNPAYDVITLGTTLGVALSAGQGLFRSSANGATAAAFYGGTIKGLLFEEITVSKGVDIAVVLRGTLYARRVPGLANNSVQSALPLIVFSNSY